MARLAACPVVGYSRQGIGYPRFSPHVHCVPTKQSRQVASVENDINGSLHLFCGIPFHFPDPSWGLNQTAWLLVIVWIGPLQAPTKELFSSQYVSSVIRSRPTWAKTNQIGTFTRANSKITRAVMKLSQREIIKTQTPKYELSLSLSLSLFLSLQSFQLLENTATRTNKIQIKSESAPYETEICTLNKKNKK